VSDVPDTRHRVCALPLPKRVHSHAGGANRRARMSVPVLHSASVTGSAKLGKPYRDRWTDSSDKVREGDTGEI
jgi:hypothetical protein